MPPTPRESTSQPPTGTAPFSLAPSARQAEPSLPEGAPITVLVIDDEESIQDLLAIVLEREGYRVITAADGREGLDLFWDRRPDAVVTDLNMPQLNGFKVCEILKEHPESQAIPVILLTGWEGGPSEQIGSCIGADAYLTKPVDIDQVAQLVVRLLSEKRRTA